jgi:hypothetical protein
MSPELAAQKLEGQLKDPVQASKLIAESNGNAVAAYTKWFNNYAKTRVIPANFRE